MTTTKTEIKKTELGKSYWDNNGIYQTEHDALYKKLVPEQGSAETIHGELLRATSRLFYDYCNNGNCNVCEEDYETEGVTCCCCSGTGVIYEGDEDNEEIVCNDCGGIGTYEEEYMNETVISPYYGKLIELIRTQLPNELPEAEVNHIMDKVEGVIFSDKNSSSYFNDVNLGVYNDMVDAVVWYILNTENGALPENYERG